MADPDTVTNEYRAELGRALPGARSRGEESVDAFVVTRRAMEADAWVGGESDDFASVCATKSTDAEDAAGACVSALESRYAAEPAMVPRTDPRARF